VVVAGRFRYVRDEAAEVPRTAPQLAGTRVPGPSDPAAARRFCGVPRDASPGAAAVAAGGVPAPRAVGASCREKTRAWIGAARARGLLARAAVGVAWDGSAFVWHEWAEVRVPGGWLAVDPSFGQRPAEGPRFTLARFADDDAGARDAAGVKILDCWGRAPVE
jgi:transglutaminase-like putative cysteine protease